MHAREPFARTDNSMTCPWLAFVDTCVLLAALVYNVIVKLPLLDYSAHDTRDFQDKVEQKAKNVRVVFRNFDEDKSGALDRDEFVNLYCAQSSASPRLYIYTL